MAVSRKRKTQNYPSEHQKSDRSSASSAKRPRVTHHSPKKHAKSRYPCARGRVTKPILSREVSPADEPALSAPPVRSGRVSRSVQQMLQKRFPYQKYAYVDYSSLGVIIQDPSPHSPVNKRKKEDIKCETRSLEIQTEVKKRSLDTQTEVEKRSLDIQTEVEKRSLETQTETEKRETATSTETRPHSTPIEDEPPQGKTISESLSQLRKEVSMMQSIVYLITEKMQREVCRHLKAKLVCDDTGFFTQRIVRLPCGHSADEKNWNYPRQDNCMICNHTIANAPCTEGYTSRAEYIWELLLEIMPDQASLHSIRNDNSLRQYCEHIANATAPEKHNSLPLVGSHVSRKLCESIINTAVEEASQSYKNSLAAYQDTLQPQRQQPGRFGKLKRFLVRALHTDLTVDDLRGY